MMMKAKEATQIKAKAIIITNPASGWGNEKGEKRC
jgi:hypothetical protein